VARADSTIRVNIVGDARALQGALRTSDKAVGGFGKTAAIAGGAIASAFAVDAVVDFGQSALAEFDRVGDATTRLEEQLGDLSRPLIDAADEFAHLGQSKQDILELEARLADMGTAAGIADEKLAPMAQSASVTAAALALLGDADADTIIEAIGKAAGGSDRPLKDLGISLTDAEVEARALADTGKDTASSLTESELAAARLALILEKLAPRVQAVTDGEADLEARQSTLQAKFETLTGKIGEHLEGPLNDFLTWVLSGIEGLENLDKALEIIGDQFGAALRPIGLVNDALQTFVGLINDAWTGWGLLEGILGAPVVGRSPGKGGALQPNSNVNVTVQGGSPEEVQSAVLKAITTLGNHGTEFDN
jgi:hypothetical protein